MDIQAEKLKIMKLILETENPSILNSIKILFVKEKGEDFWDSLSRHEQEEITKGFKDIENGQVIDYNQFIARYK